MIKSTTLVFLLTIAVLATTHYMSLHFYLYWLFPWIDNVSHSLGGTSVALGWFTLRDFLPKIPKRWLRFWPTIFVVMTVAVAWEVFEVLIGVSVFEEGYVVDTVSDLLFDLIGGLVGYVVAKRLSEDL